MNDDRTVERSALPTIPGYRVERTLGAGGMAVVYLATDETLERDVAIKLLSGDSDDAKARFLREARSMAGVKHANIVPIYTFGECDAGAYLVMEHCEGGTLAERIPDGTTVSLAVETITKIARALEAAWKKGIVHRDVKPSNILMDADGSLFVADFGLAKRVDTKGDASLTEEGVFVGTPHYISPEVAAGEKADHRSDIYALGIMLFELLTGERPFEAATPIAVVALHIHKELPNLEEKCPQASGQLVALVGSMTAKDPARRPQSYEELLEKLESDSVRKQASAAPKRGGKRIFMDRHNITDAMTPEELLASHQQDLELQGQYDVKALTYWFDHEHGRVHCLMEAPDAETVTELHRHAHGDLPNEIIEVQPEMVQAFMGRMADPIDLGEQPISESGFRTLLVATVANAAALANELGDEDATDAIRDHVSLLRDLIGKHGGRHIRSIGDGFLASFGSTAKGVECAIAMQRATTERKSPVRIKVALNSGEPVSRSNDLFGATVNLTESIAAYSSPDSILTSQVVRDLCRGKKLPFTEHGDVELSGFDEPMRLFEVDWRENAQDP